MLSDKWRGCKLLRYESMDCIPLDYKGPAFPLPLEIDVRAKVKQRVHGKTLSYGLVRGDC